MRKIIIIGASYLQTPLIQKAKSMGIQTHVFAWEEGAVAKKYADYFYPISIVEKEKILNEAKKIKPDGIISIASDLAMITVNYVATELGLISNSLECTEQTTNKFLMRNALSNAKLPCPRFIRYNFSDKMDFSNWTFPLIVKPTDRSGSRGVTKVYSVSELEESVKRAYEESLVKEVIIEEFIEGREISVETISWKGTHHFLACTDKVTTGAPYFVEIEQHQPAELSTQKKESIIELVKKALTSLKIKYGASHSELLIDKEDNVYFVEIGARMGGDHIGAELVQLSTGYDFVKGVIDVAMGDFVSFEINNNNFSGIYYLKPKEGIVKQIKNHCSIYNDIIKNEIFVQQGDLLTNTLKESAERLGYFIYSNVKSKSIYSSETIIEIITA